MRQYERDGKADVTAVITAVQNYAGNCFTKQIESFHAYSFWIPYEKSRCMGHPVHSG
jgi:hypothetical protein